MAIPLEASDVPDTPLVRGHSLRRLQLYIRSPAAAYTACCWGVAGRRGLHILRLSFARRAVLCGTAKRRGGDRVPPLLHRKLGRATTVAERVCLNNIWAVWPRAVYTSRGTL